MNDFEFGNFVYTHRCRVGMTQSEMARLLGVTNKAVSKWETGKSKPTTNTLRKIAVLFGLSMDELLTVRKGRKQMDITKIVIIMVLNNMPKVVHKLLVVLVEMVGMTYLPVQIYGLKQQLVNLVQEEILQIICVVKVVPEAAASMVVEEVPKLPELEDLDILVMNYYQIRKWFVITVPLQPQ